MAPGWRSRFNKRDRFHKLDDDDGTYGYHGGPYHEDMYRKEISPMTSSTAFDDKSPSNVRNHSGCQSLTVNTVLTPETASINTSTTITPRASPVSLSSKHSVGSQNSQYSGNSKPDSATASLGVNTSRKPRSAMELDNFIIHQEAGATAASAAVSPLKQTASEEDLVEIYEAEERSSFSYQTSDPGTEKFNPPGQKIIPLEHNVIENDNENPHNTENDDSGVDDLVEMVSSPVDLEELDGFKTSCPVDLDELEDLGEEAALNETSSVPSASVCSRGTNDSEDLYLEDLIQSENPIQSSMEERNEEDAPRKEDISQVKALVASFNKNSSTPLTLPLLKPQTVQRAKSIPLVPPPPVKPRPVPVPVPTKVPNDCDERKAPSRNASFKKNRKDSPSKHSRSSKHEDDDGATPIEIHGIDLLEERDNSVSELQEMSHLMTFNALILIQKQKDWLEGSSAKNKSASLKFELENMERKIKLLSDHKEWPNQMERAKQQRDPLTPSKAFFKAMALLDRSIEQFHQGYLSFTAQKSQENHELKRTLEQLQVKNSALLQELQAAQHTMQHFENERNDLAKQVMQMEKHLSLVQIKSNEDELDDSASSATDVCANNGTFLSKVFNIKSYIESLEEQQREHIEEIKMLKSKVPTEEVDYDAETDEENVAELERARSMDSGYLDDDLGSRWHTLETNEVATEKAAELERQVTELCAKLADREQDLTSLRSECKLIRMQLLQEERTRNDFKAQLAEKDSILSIANERITTLEEEVLKTHARCATYEEDYAALKESFATQKEATLKELGSTQEDTKAQLEKLQTDYENKLRDLEENLLVEKSERDRLVRDLKTALAEIEAERDQLKSKMESSSPDYDGEEKKDPDVEQEKTSTIEKMSKLEDELKQFERMRERLAEKACVQASKIAALTEANENKEVQLTSLQQMVEMLLEERESHDKTAANQIRHRLASLRNKVIEGADSMMEQVKDRKSGGMFNRSQHGN